MRDRLPSVDALRDRIGEWRGKRDGRGRDWDVNWRAIGAMMAVFGVVAMIGVLLYSAGRWPFGPYRGLLIAGVPAYPVVLVSTFLATLLAVPLYVYFIAPAIGLGSTLSRLLWVVASFAQGATIFDRAADGRYYARPLRKKPDDSEVAQMYVDGGWHDVPGNIEFVSRLGWRPVAFTWEKSDHAMNEIRATDEGEPPVEYLTSRGLMDRETAIQYQPEHQIERAVADGGVEGDFYSRYRGKNETGSVPYHILDYIGHAYQAFNPWPDGPDDGYLIDTRKVKRKLEKSGETRLIERAKDGALTKTARSSRINQLAGWGMIFLALMAGVGVAYFTV